MSVWLWNVVDPAKPSPLGLRFAGPGDYVSSLAFSRDGHTLASAGFDAVRLWDLDLGHLAKWICSAGESALSPDLWRKYVPELPYKPPCRPAG